MRRVLFMIQTCLMASVSVSCRAADSFALCPDLGAVGKGSYEYEDARRCVSVMAARYSVSGEAPADIATAALEWCDDRKIEPLVASESSETAEKLRAVFEAKLRNLAVQTVVEMRAGKCALKPNLYDHINDPIDRPKVGD